MRRVPERLRFRSPVDEIFRRGEGLMLREGTATVEDAFDLLKGLSRDSFASERKDNAAMDRRMEIDD